jgi:hypothetical protein
MKFKNYLTLVVIIILFGTCKPTPPDVCAECTASDKSGNAPAVSEDRCWPDNGLIDAEMDMFEREFKSLHDTALYNISCQFK